MRSAEAYEHTQAAPLVRLVEAKKAKQGIPRADRIAYRVIIILVLVNVINQVRIALGW